MFQIQYITKLQSTLCLNRSLKNTPLAHPPSMRVLLLSEVSENPAVASCGVLAFAPVPGMPGMLKAKSGHTWYCTQQ